MCARHLRLAGSKESIHSNHHHHRFHHQPCVHSVWLLLSFGSDAMSPTPCGAAQMPFRCLLSPAEPSNPQTGKEPRPIPRTAPGKELFPQLEGPGLQGRVGKDPGDPPPWKPLNLLFRRTPPAPHVLLWTGSMSGAEKALSDAHFRDGWRGTQQVCSTAWRIPGDASGKELTVNRGDLRDMSSIPGLGSSPGGGHGNPLQYSCLENPMERGA